MRVLTYLDCPRLFEKSGISTAAAHHRLALKRATTAITPLTDPLAVPPHRVPDYLLRGRDPIVDYDLVHCHATGPGSLALARHARARDRPLVCHAHVTAEDFANSVRGSTAGANALRRYLRWFYSQADLVCCPSQYTASILDDYPIDAPIEPITNGIDLDTFEDIEAFRRPYREHYDLEGPVVFAVGNVFERKGVTTFCQLAIETEYEFVWFGPYDRGPLTSDVVRRWTDDPPANVTFTGWIEDRRAAFAAGDVFCFPTTVENQGIAVLEAMACGKAVVLRKIPVFEALYTHGEDCLLCSTRSEFRQALDRLAANQSLRTRLGENARETAADHRLERVGKRLSHCYRRLVDGGHKSC